MIYFTVIFNFYVLGKFYLTGCRTYFFFQASEAFIERRFSLLLVVQLRICIAVRVRYMPCK
jgi:hypothetical protein